MTFPAVESVWMNGTLKPWREATVHVLTHALHYGTGVFEGLRCYETPFGPAIFRLDEHIDRLAASARVVRMPLPYSAPELKSAVVEVIRVNQLGACYIRPIAFRGYGGLGLNASKVPVDMAVAAWPWGTYLGSHALEHGIRVTISSWRRNDPNVIPPDCKLTGAYITSCLATEDAENAGYQEALMLNQQGYIAEGTGENLFIVSRGTLYTPPLASGLLPGVTRMTIIELAHDLGIEVAEQQLSRHDLYRAEEIFCVGTAAEVVPVREVDGRTLAAPGVVTKVLQDRFFAVVQGTEEKYHSWFTFVHREKSA